MITVSSSSTILQDFSHFFEWSFVGIFESEPRVYYCWVSLCFSVGVASIIDLSETLDGCQVLSFLICV